MTSKERAEFRSKAHSLQPLFQVGKGGVNEALIQQTNDALRVRELIKLRVLLETCPKSPKEIAVEIAQATGAEVISVIGGSMIFYKYSEELHAKEKQKKANIKAILNKKREDAKNKAKKARYGGRR
ncbi:MAG: YhbY family RNA-binding protein [Clostridia bacterium]|nr:YhbY family RNA-binding protein [Clostridia bacterium]